jgi:malonate transporter
MILNIILPVYSIILIGKLLKQKNIINTAFIKTSYKFLDNFLLPLLIFWTIAQPIQSKNDTSDFLIVLTLACVLTYALIHLFIYISNLQPQDASLLAQGSYRFNVYICLALAYGYDKPIVRDICLFIGFGLPTIDFLTFFTFNRLSQKKFTINELSKIFFNGNIFKPLLPATVFGIILSAVDVHWPLLISKSFDFVIPAIVPLALILIGGSLSFKFLRKPHLLPIISSCFKFIALPVIGYIGIRLFSIDALTAKIIMITLVLPCSVTFSLNFGSDINRIYEYNSVSTMLSLVFLSAIAFFM